MAWYSNRLEIFSPGHFAGPFIQETLGDGTSYIRNKVLALTGRKLSLIEKRGTGIRLILDLMEKHNQRVVFIEGPNWFKTVLHFPSHEKIDETDTYSATVLDMLKNMKEIKNSDVCKRLSVSKATGASILNRMISQGTIIKTGRGPGTRYRMNR